MGDGITNAAALLEAGDGIRGLKVGPNESITGVEEFTLRLRQEIPAFTVPARTAVDISAACATQTDGNPCALAGAVIRVYGCIGGRDFLVGEVTFPYEIKGFSGRCAALRGGAESWKVTITGGIGATFRPSEKSSLAIYAYGTEPIAQDFVDLTQGVKGEQPDNATTRPSEGAAAAPYFLGPDDIDVDTSGVAALSRDSVRQVSVCNTGANGAYLILYDAPDEGLLNGGKAIAIHYVDTFQSLAIDLRESNSNVGAKDGWSVQNELINVGVVSNPDNPNGTKVTSSGFKIWAEVR